MQIIRDRRISKSHWRHVPDDSLAEELNSKRPGAIIVALSDWRNQRKELLLRGTKVGVRLTSADSLDDIVDDLHAIAVVALEFGSFADGRGYTQARQLRERHGYGGEIRAVGDVSRDRLAFMERCGFNAFELRPGSDLRGALNAFGEISDVYQPAADGQSVIAARRL